MIDDDDPGLRGTLSELRDHDRAHAPPFGATWEAARSRARAAKRARLVLALAAAALVALAILIARPPLADAPPPVASIDREPLAILLDPLPRLALEDR